MLCYSLKHSSQMDFDTVKFSNGGENIIDDNTSEGYSNNEFDFESLSATSTNCTNNNQIYTSDSLENVNGSSVNIGSITVQNASDVTIGNKIFFNAPVEIKQLVVDCGEQNVDATRNSTEPAEPKLPWRLKGKHYFVNHPFKALATVSATMMMVATLVIAGCYYNPSGIEITSACEEIPSDPTHYTCAQPSACGRCKAMYSHTEICRASYDHSCGDLQCFCKPDCVSSDCQV